VEIRGDDGEVIVLDAGTGARPLGNELMNDPPARVDLLLTHLHVDHLEGLGMFGPIWSPDTELHIWGPSSPVASLDERIATYFSPPLFPVHLAEVPARVRFHDAPRDPWTIGSVTVTAHPILHPGATVGYRLESAGRAIAYVTDHEPALGTDLDAVDASWISGYALARRADVLIHDCQYTDGGGSGVAGGSARSPTDSDRGRLYRVPVSGSNEVAAASSAPVTDVFV
jgi:phosphoribosyl 1,2-cyclic phosphodiesterase